MTTPLWCLVAVMFFPIPLAILGSAFRAKAFGHLDNKNPRPQAAKLEGIGARAYAAQQNAWEATAFFTVTIFACHLAGVTAESATPWALAFVGFRILHGILYLSDLDKARSITFFGAMACIFKLLWMAGSA